MKLSKPGFQFDLGCQEWKRTLVGTIHGLGLMTALAFIGTLSDLYVSSPLALFYFGIFL